MAKPEPIQLNVIRSVDITPNMRRITLGGDALESFPSDQDSAYIKLLFPNASGGKPILRTYTIRHHREDKNELDVDFMLHGDNGPASSWATHVQVGDSITIAGPGLKKLLDFSADWFFLAGDMTALPAISVNLSKLPQDAQGYAVIEVLSEADIQDLQVPQSFQLHWVINPSPMEQNSVLLDRVKQMQWLEGTPSIWAASEFSTMRALRDYFKKERQVQKGELYISSYWKRGLTEEQHKVTKREDEQSQ